MEITECLERGGSFIYAISIGLRQIVVLKGGIVWAISHTNVVWFHNTDQHKKLNCMLHNVTKAIYLCMYLYCMCACGSLCIHCLLYTCVHMCSSRAASIIIYMYQ